MSYSTTPEQKVIRILKARDYWTRPHRPRDVKPLPLENLTEKRKQEREIVGALMEKLGETGKTLRAILADTMKDYDAASVKRLYQKVVLGKAPIRTGPGCFYISIGDGRKKHSDVIRIRP